MSMYNSHIDDLIHEIIEDFYKEYKITYQKHTNISLKLARYFNVRLKFIEIRPRKVHVSKEFIKDIFVSEYKDDILLLLEKIKRGIDVNPNQSKKSFNADYHDMLFNDWNIHHLHLNHNKKRPRDYFNIRTGPLLFIKFDLNNAYVLDVKHHHDQNVWSDTDIIRIIRNNWNYLLEPYEVGDGNWFPNLDDEGMGNLRNKGYIYPVNVDNKTYMLLGHGYATSGDNMTANRLADDVHRWVGKNLEFFKSDKENFKKELLEKMYL